jgi:hypothetical protein
VEDVEKKLKRLTDMMLESEVPRTFIAKASELEVSQADLAAKKKSKESEISTLSTVHHTAESRTAELKAISAAMVDNTGGDLYELRSRLVQSIRAIVQDIYLYPAGDPQKNVAVPFYMIEFKNGGFRYIKMRREGEIKRVKILLEKVNAPLKVNKFKPTKSVSEILRHK